MKPLGTRMYLAVRNDGLKVRSHADQLQPDDSSAESCVRAETATPFPDWLDSEDEPMEADNSPSTESSSPPTVSLPSSAPSRRYPLRSRYQGLVMLPIEVVST